MNNKYSIPTMEEISGAETIITNEDYVQHIFMQAPVAILMLKGKDYEVEMANELMMQIIDKNSSLLNKPLFDSMPELIDQVKADMDGVFESGIAYHGKEFEARLILNGKNENRFFNFVFHPKKEIDETTSGIIVVANDITDQIQARKKIEESEHRYHEMIHSSESLIAILQGEDYIISIANDAIIEQWGKGKDIIGKPLLAVLPEVKEQGFGEILQNVYITGETYYAHEMPVSLIRNGILEVCYFNFTYQAQRNIKKEICGIAILAKEVSPQALFNLQIKESEERFRTLADDVPFFIFIIEPNAEAIVSFWNKNWLDYTGQSLELAIGNGWKGIIHEDDIPFVMEIYTTAFEKKEAYILPNIRVRRKDGLYRWHQVKVNPRFMPNGDFIGFIGVCADVHEEKIKEDALIENEARFRNLIEKAPVPICIMEGEDMRLNVANEVMLNIWQVGREVIGKAFLNIKPEMAAQPFMGLLLDVYKNGVTHYGNEAPAYLINKKGEKEHHFYNFVYQPNYDGNDVITGVMILAADVTEQVLARKANTATYKAKAKELEEKVVERTIDLVIANEALQEKNNLIEENNKLLQQKNEEIHDTKEKLLTDYSRSLIEASIDPLVTIGTDGKIMDVNEAMINAVDKKRSALIGTDFKNYFTDPLKAKAVYEEVFTKGFVKDYPLTMIDGVLTDVLFNGAVYKNVHGKVQGAVVVARDMTEQKKVEQDLTEARIFAEFATTIAEEAKEKAEVYAAAAEEAVKAKQQFLSNMSHEIRTPMNAIIGFTKVVLKTELSPKQKEYIGAIKMSGDALIVLINDILDLAKVDSGKMTFEKAPFKLALSIDAMLHLFETKIAEKNLNLIKKYDKKIPKVLIGDAIRLHQIILNLVGNAVKFTEYGSITMGVKLVGENKEKVTVEFSITDTGIGIREEKLQSIFENFSQATAITSRLYGGSGLGLAIVKQLVDLQGGNITVKSEIDKGSTFSFILNFDKSDSDEILEAEIMELDEDVKDVKILVVEDMPLNQLLMKTLLDDFGFESDITANGKLALEKLATKTYDIILMDLQMPEMNGFEATEYIRNTLKSTIPIIALTADVTTVDVAKCKAVGMNDYIAKPVDERLLYSKIVSLVKKPVVIVSTELLIEAIEEQKIIKCIDLKYLDNRTKSNPALMMQMMSIYLEQTPPLISLMKKSFKEKDWDNLDAAVHKMIPSFAIMGMSKDYEAMAKKLQRYAVAKQEEEDMHDLVTQLENILGQSCRELEIEFNNMKNNSK
jgi:PAS domain S-box-containing protein